MELPALDRASVRSPYADQLNEGFARLRFNALLEKEYREFYIAQVLPRGRLAVLIALVPLAVIAAVQLLLGDGLQRDTAFRLVGLIPVLAAAAIAMHLPIARRAYAQIAAVSVLLSGVLITWFAHASVVEGGPSWLGVQTLLFLFACLFLGLLFNVAVAVGATLYLGHVAAGLLLGVPGDELWYSAAILGTGVAAALITTYRLEHVLRQNFLETRLLHSLAERDGLTGLYNRRIFDDYAKRVWRQSRREGKTLGVILVDIDAFKNYNDLYGHQAGDDALRKVAQAIARSAKRPFDFTARYGGEEFVMLLYGPPDDYARSLPEQIRGDVLALAIPHAGTREGGVVTVSVGAVIAQPESGRSLAGLIQLADEALYQAKQEGGNRVVIRSAEDREAETGNFRRRRA